MGKEEDAAATWGALLSLFLGTQRPRFHVLGEREGLTARVIQALLNLPDEPQPMSALAEQWFCDASNVTGIVDALESRGLAERVAHPGDRRVRLVQLTPEGVAARERCVRHLSQPPPQLMHLTADELRALRRLIERAGSV